MLDRITNEGKQKELPLQMLTVTIGETKKEDRQLLNRGEEEIEIYRDRLKKKLKNLRCQQLAKDPQRLECSAHKMFIASFSHSALKRKYFWAFVKIMTDLHSIKTLQPIRRRYITKWEQLCTQKNVSHRNTLEESSLQMTTELTELEDEISQNSLGLEHFNREIGQNYEMLSYLNKEPQSQLAKVTAEMLLEGYPIELMDGDATHVPLIWIKAVFNSLEKKIGNKRMFVLSVLGIQSSGKSTMLNAMFGLQFAVSAGRCTKGIFAQLVTLDKGLREKTQCDYILVVDTEGLRSPEFASIQQANYRDNELATLVIGLGDLTIINIMGENTADIQDTLQIAVHAFMKMENVKIKPSCLFVHQNITDVTASDLNAAQKRKMREILDKITKIAAEKENCSDKYESFSDVINFQENEHVMYISSLLKGDPPMAPPNPGYSQGILQVKKQVLKFAANADAKYIGDFTKLLSNLWEAILCQDFVFSFKNSLEIIAYTSLTTEYVKQTRIFRVKALEYSYELQNRCKKLKAEEIREHGKNILDEYLHKLQKDIKCQQWKFKLETQISSICEEVKQERLIGEYTSIKKKTIGRREIDETIKNQEKYIYQQAKQLADVYRQQPISDDKLQTEFTKKWNEWVSDIPPGDKYEGIETSFQNIATEEFLNKDKSEIIRILQSSDCQTKVLEKDLYFGKLKEFTSWFGFGSKQDVVNKANLRTKKILENLIAQISGHEMEGRKYTKQIGSQLFGELSSGLEEVKIDGKVGISVKGQIRLAVCNFKVILIPMLEKVQEKHKLENDPKLYMESKKERLWEMFKTDCKDLQLVVKISTAISREFTKAIQLSLPKKCQLGMIEYLQRSSSKGFSSKMSLHAWMLVEMAENGNFESFEQYLSDPIQCIKTFTSEQIQRICFQKSKTGCSQLQEIHGRKVREIINGLHEAINSQNAKGTITMKSWWPTFLKHIGNIICVEADIRFFDEDRDLNLNELIRYLLAELKGIEDTIIEAYDQTITSEIVPFCCDFVTKDLIKCKMMCPFCKALCELYGDDHHRTECHRPQGIGGHTWIDSNKLVTERCTTSVMAGHTFKNQHTNGEWINYKQYQTVNDYYKSWKIEPLDTESEMYWKWFMATYNTELAQYYDCEKADIPDGWKSISKKEAIQKMKTQYDL
ncbi:interferon-induced very large GTPase 1-like [Antedon mediterranea]|uniref:interferon-induced very large GTPase 1-like n=1 Tax=Antedon mediterranea TaxID=105859 RepID=UPI003AF4FFFB